MPGKIDLRQFDALTFDCYGTLVDWEAGILTGLRPVLAEHQITLADGDILGLYADFEAKAESGAYRKYREILRDIVLQFGEGFAFVPTPAEVNALVNSLPEWKPFPDTVTALRTLKTRFRLAVISNIDDDLFALTARHLQVPFDEVITAEQVCSYKPARRNFEIALSRVGLPKTGVLHVAQSLYHDIAPAKALGLATAWVSRRKGRTASGPTEGNETHADLEIPDLQSLADLMISQGSSAN